MRHFLSSRHVGLILLVLGLEHAFSGLFFSLNARADLLYLVVLDYAFFWNWDRVPFFAMVVGLAADFLGAHLFGIETLSLVLSSLLLSYGIQKLERDNYGVRMAITFLFVALTETVEVMLGTLLETSQGLAVHFVGSILVTTALTVLAAPLFFWFTDRWFQRRPVLKQYELF